MLAERKKKSTETQQCAEFRCFVLVTRTGIENISPIFLIIDEANCLLDPTGKSKAEKDFIAQITQHLLTITCLGRAAHIHLICICQRSDVGSIPGALKANMEIRITSHCADKESSITILGNGDAAALPKIPGRFLSSDGTEFQGYDFSVPPCDITQKN